MKRKLFSAILFGALLVASTSGLTSCKDYDDDITNLQSQIDKLATKEELSAKAGELANTISTAQQAANAAKETADKALAAAQGASTDAKAAADAAKAAQAKADEVAGDLKDAVAAAATQIQEAVKDLATRQEVIDRVKEVADKYDAQAKELKALSDRLAKVEAKLGMGEGGEDIDLTEIQKELDAIEKDLEAIIGKVADMVTSVELVYSSAHSTENNLDFNVITEEKNETFGKDVADKILTTTKGHTKFYGDEVLIRVNPVDAEFSASDVSLINSKGEELTGLVEATKVERYTSDKYLTRAAGANTGLWKVTFAPVDGQKADDLKKKFAVREGQDAKSIVYGVAIKSAINDTISANRRVVSAYDVTMAIKEGNNYVANLPGYRELTATDTVGILANNKWVSEIKNRSVDGSNELIWNTNEPAVVVDKEGDDANVKKGDNRTSKDYLVARVGEEIKIEFKQKIKGFYVTLDKAFAEEGSAPSEINAWNSYKYENVGKDGVKATMFEGSKGTIKVSSLSGEATGDVIGFRIYAMNLDGTLVDPDGIAFYVNLGDEGVNVNLGTKDIIVKSPTSNESESFAVAEGTFDKITSVVWTVKNGNATVSVTENTDYSVEYYDSKAKAWTDFNSIANKDKVNAVRFNIKKPVNFKDNETFAFNAVLNASSSQGTTYEKSYLTANLTKKLPNSAPAYKWNEGQSEEQIVKPAGYASNIETALAVNTSAVAVVKKDLSDMTPKDGNLNFNDMFIQSASGNPSIASDTKFIFYLATSQKNADTKQWTDALKVESPYNAPINSSLVNCTTAHAVSTEYNYGAISSKTFENRAENHEHDWIVNTTSGYSIKYMTWSYKNSNYMGFKWATTNVAAEDEPANYLPYDNNKIDETINIATARIAAVHGSKITTGLRKTTLKDYLTANWLKIVDVQTEGVESGIANPYYELDREATNPTKIVLKRKAGTQNVPVHSEKVKVKVADCYGHTETYEFVLKLKNETAYPELLP